MQKTRWLVINWCVGVHVYVSIHYLISSFWPICKCRTNRRHQLDAIINMIKQFKTQFTMLRGHQDRLPVT